MMQTLRSFFTDITLVFTGFREKELCKPKLINKMYKYKAYIDATDRKGLEIQIQVQIMEYFSDRGVQLDPTHAIVYWDSKKPYLYIELNSIDAMFNEDRFLNWFKKENPEFSLR